MTEYINPNGELSGLQKDIAEWTRTNFPNQHNNPQLQLLGVIEECGELCHYELKKAENIRNVSREDAIDAVGDIVIFLMNYCTASGLLFEHCIATAWAEVHKRNWILYPLNGRTE